MTMYTVEGPHKSTIEEAAISTIKKAISIHGNNAQAIHIIIANIIFTNNSWTGVFSVVREPIRDDDFDEAIIFAQLPRKYEGLHERILPHVDHLNVIEDDSIWKNIKLYLLDIYFYQAVHFEKIERITEAGGGYFREVKEEDDTDLDVQFSFNPEILLNSFLLKTTMQSFNSHFSKEVEVDSEEAKLLIDREDRYRMRNIIPNRDQALLRVLRLEG